MIGPRTKLDGSGLGCDRCIALEELVAENGCQPIGNTTGIAHPGDRRAKAEDVAYCMYTSGSTGEPRGVEIEHRSVTAFIRAFNSYMRFDESSRCLNTSPYHFDVSVSDVLMPLVLGVTVYIVPSLLPPSRVLERIETARITHFCPPAPLLTLLCGPGSTFDSRDLTSLRCIMTGAEVIAQTVVARWLDKVPGLRILNAYGPTEATCACTAYEITQSSFFGQRELPIGYPFEGVYTLLLSPEGRSEPGLVSGELAVAGVQVMRGYWNRPAETAERIIMVEGRRYYRTGDLCEVDEEGRYYFRGRRDNEVKLRVYRVTLDEIRPTLMWDSRVSQAVAGIVKVKSGQASVGIGVVLKLPGTVAVLEDIVGGLKQRLPIYMLPEYGLVSQSFPRLPSGKTDARQVIELLTEGVNSHSARWFKLDQGRVLPVA